MNLDHDEAMDILIFQREVMKYSLWELSSNAITLINYFIIIYYHSISCFIIIYYDYETILY